MRQALWFKTAQLAPLCFAVSNEVGVRSANFPINRIANQLSLKRLDTKSIKFQSMNIKRVEFQIGWVAKLFVSKHLNFKLNFKPVESQIKLVSK